jgi:GTP-binding protein
VDRFVDEATIEVTSGNGGTGAVSFRREKYIARGGPDGGDGGRGGSVLFKVQSNLKTLSHLRMKPHFKAGNGAPGRGGNKTGADGKDSIVPVPPGTVVKDLGEGRELADLCSEGQTWTFLTGGRGGKGNTHFKTSTHQTPRFSQPGEAGETRRVRVELRLIADVGLVGKPNAGKSSLLTVLTNAKPQVAAYPFTTKIPYLGVLRDKERELIIADIPGLIKGAAAGSGLGHRFLKHIGRTRMLAVLLDLSEENCEATFAMLMNELAAFSPALQEKEYVIVGTKLDMPEAEEKLDKLKKRFEGGQGDVRVLGLSSFTHRGLAELSKLLLEKCGKIDNTIGGKK